VTLSNRIASSHRAARRVCKAPKSVLGVAQERAQAHIVRLRRGRAAHTGRCAPFMNCAELDWLRKATLWHQSSGAVVWRTPAGVRRTASTLHGALQARHTALQQPVGHGRIFPSFHPFLSSPPPPRPARSGTVRLAAQTLLTSAAHWRSRHWRAVQAARRGYRLSGDAWGFSTLPRPLARPFSSGWAARLVTPLLSCEQVALQGTEAYPKDKAHRHFA
jgi:hypothetical protein